MLYEKILSCYKKQTSSWPRAIKHLERRMISSVAKYTFSVYQAANSEHNAHLIKPKLEVNNAHTHVNARAVVIFNEK
eukprot:1159115-Pelagomonas_calceolata.AAC.2